MTEARELHIGGIVQGVGFRPFIYRQARRWGLAGRVRNASDGVHVHIEGESRSLDGFIAELSKEAPSAARIDSCEYAEGHIEGLEGFSIDDSDPNARTDTLVSPDLATCPACLRELFDPNDRRYHYPFINCTDCGPRFTIIDALPYDRPNTSMASFEMCADCAREYHDPLNRRFHAQPDACFFCGPSLSLWLPGAGQAVEEERSGRAASDALIEKVAELLMEGRIVAIKGLGGYHLACDASNEEAVATLRQRKRRAAKPFALMVRDVASARALCVIDEQEEALLGSAARPIVLLRRRGAAALAEAGALAPSVAGGLHELGLMLPSTPVQHLLMALLARPLVMTSGNISEEPIIADVREAHQALGQVADAFLDNNRAIRSRYDDSVLRVIDGRAFFVRRARGYAPVPLKVHRALGQGATGGQEAQKAEGARHAKLQDAKAREGGILAVGPEQKSSFCLMRNHRAFVSQHLGDLEGSSAFAAWHSTLNLYQRLFDLPYDLIACDPHPEYLSTKWARAQPERRIEVQHHHAHIASVLAEELAAQTRTQVGAVIGVAFDGSGYGSDGSIWGGEVLIATLENFERFACLRPCPLPGGKAAITRPERMAYSYLLSLELSEHPGARGLLTDIGPEGLGLLERIVSQRVNSPLTSSMGRLFDAASALAGVCGISSYEGQAAVEFEAALYDPTTGMPSREPEGSDVGPAPRYRFELRQGENMGAGLGLIIEPRPVLASLLDDCAAELPTSIISLRFHEAVASLIVEVCQQARARYGLEDVALGGGVFMNRYLLTRAIALLRAEGFTVLLNRELPANDGCISYGQAIVAAARLARERGEDILVKAVDDATHDATR